jgi:hypothetical protein
VYERGQKVVPRVEKRGRTIRDGITKEWRGNEEPSDHKGEERKGRAIRQRSGDKRKSLSETRPESKGRASTHETTKERGGEELLETSPQRSGEERKSYQRQVHKKVARKGRAIRRDHKGVAKKGRAIRDETTLVPNAMQMRCEMEWRGNEDHKEVEKRGRAGTTKEWGGNEELSDHKGERKSYQTKEWREREELIRDETGEQRKS